MTDLFTIQKITAENVCEIPRLYIENFGPEEFDEEGWFDKHCNEIVTNPAYFGYYAMDNDTIAGEIVCHWESSADGSSAHLYVWSLSIRAQYRRKGIGTRLLHLAYENAPDAHHFYLHTASNNVNAQALYLKEGFTITETVPNFYNEKSDCREAYIMTRPNELYTGKLAPEHAFVQELMDAKKAENTKV